MGFSDLGPTLVVWSRPTPKPRWCMACKLGLLDCLGFAGLCAPRLGSLGLSPGLVDPQHAAVAVAAELLLCLGILAAGGLIAPDPVTAAAAVLPLWAVCCCCCCCWERIACCFWYLFQPPLRRMKLLMYLWTVRPQQQQQGMTRYTTQRQGD